MANNGRLRAMSERWERLVYGTEALLRSMIMPPNRTDAELTELIPEMRDWNGGAGIDPESWIGCMGNYELAIGYSLVFWPRFVLLDDHVLRHGYTESQLRRWQACQTDRAAVEAVMNHLHMDSLHYGAEKSELQLRYLGRLLRQVHELKLAAEFPGRQFVVTFNDEPGLALTDYQLTFWQS